MYNKDNENMLALRLNKKLEKEIENTAKAMGISKSELIRKSIVEYLNKEVDKKAWVVGEELFGRYSSDDPNLAMNSEKILRKKIKKKSK